MISVWHLNNSLMQFSQFDRLCDFKVFSLAWRFTDATDDPWTKRLNGFKNKEERSIKAACSIIPYALAEIDWPSGRYGLVSALPSKATSLPSDSGLFRLGETIANVLEWTWYPNALTKSPHKSLHTIFNACERDAEVANKYSITQDLEVDYICVLDDFITRGATMQDIKRAINKQNRAIKLFGVVLGKTEKKKYAADNGVNINNNHVYEGYATRWDAYKNQHEY